MTSYFILFTLEIMKRSIIDFNEHGTTWTFALVKREVFFILNLKRLKKPAPRFKPLLSSEVSSVLMSSWGSSEEKNLYKNAKRYYYLSTLLYDKHQYKDAYLYLHLSLEMILKVILVKARDAYDHKYKDPLPTAEEASDSLMYSHDVKALTRYLIKLIPDFYATFKVPRLLRTFGLSKETRTWQSARYSIDPSDGTNQSFYKSEYDNLRSGFLPVAVDLKAKGMFK